MPTACRSINPAGVIDTRLRVTRIRRFVSIMTAQVIALRRLLEAQSREKVAIE
jgi:hypothetical protein